MRYRRRKRLSGNPPFLANQLLVFGVGKLTVSLLWSQMQIVVLSQADLDIRCAKHHDCHKPSISSRACKDRENVSTS